MYCSIDENSKAIEEYTKCVNIDTKNVDAYLQLAQTFLKVGLKEQAVEILQKAEENNPESIDISKIEA